MNVFQAQIGIARLGNMIPEGQKVVVNPKEKEFNEYWRQTGFLAKKAVFIDPKIKFTGELKNLSPNKNITLVFTDKIPKEWSEWFKKNSIKPVVKSDLTKDKIVGLLATNAGALGDFRLTTEAAELIGEVFYEESLTGFFSICFTLENCKPENVPVMGIDDVVNIWPDENFKLAKRINDQLGTFEAVKMYINVDKQSADIFGLWRYLDIVCGTKNTQWLYLSHAYRSAADRKYISYKEALFLFIMHCYKERKGKKFHKYFNIA